MTLSFALVNHCLSANLFIYLLSTLPQFCKKYNKLPLDSPLTLSAYFIAISAHMKFTGLAALFLPVQHIHSIHSRRGF